MKTSTSVFSALLLALSLGTGCENEIDESANVLPSNDMLVMDAAPPPPDAGDGGGVPSCRDCLTAGTWYRFSTLRVESLAGGPHGSIDTLNTAWGQDIEEMELNILFEITAVEGDVVSVRAVSGAKDGDSICLLEATAVDLDLTAQAEGSCDFANLEPASLNVYAGTQDRSKSCAPGRTVPNSIPVEQLRLENQVSADCARIVAGKVVEAGIPQTAFNEVCSNIGCLAAPSSACGELMANYAGPDGECAGCNAGYQPLGVLVDLVGLGVEITADCEDSAGEPAVCLSASFEAVRLDASPAVCN